jgi:hypothetical protein
MVKKISLVILKSGALSLALALAGCGDRVGKPGSDLGDNAGTSSSDGGGDGGGAAGGGGGDMAMTPVSTTFDDPRSIFDKCLFGR